ncbi:hypothetical protein DUI87_30895 [Hirundo rustica rustica]|uniref:Transcription initiation factor TFIID subunit 9 n=1 Tax=Hirundo rustica rustica TaxID=333673 RepID=A0A3M0JCZ7_HIRRU|nr:hypothetical protein DUI87_30895 [Hirundo rustica rustica]
MGITEYGPYVINQMLEFAYRYMTTILEDAKIYSSHAKKSSVDADDVRLAIQCQTDQSFTSPPPRDFLLDIAWQKNQTPLPLIKLYSGPRLLPDRSPPQQARSQSLPERGCCEQQASTPTLATPTTPTVQNVLINPSLIGPKNILITTNMVPPDAADSNPLKRKHRDDDDY